MLTLPSTTHYRTPPSSYTFHAYSPPASPPLPDDIAPPAMSTKRASRLSAPFPTFLYANEPPPVTARNKQRVRPTPAQLADLKTLYAATAHPTREEREALGRRIGMRYQSVTNWFQNQRSTAKKRDKDDHDDDEPEPERTPRPVLVAPPPPPPSSPPSAAAARRIDPVRDIIAHATRPSPPPPPPPAAHPIPIPLPLSGSSILPTLPPPPTLLSSFQTTPAPSAPASPAPYPYLSPSPHTPPSSSPSSSSPSSSSDTPSSSHRGKRSRPTPHQLAVLRALHAETTSPSIEARVRVGRQIGMELGKVTNWFRNLRQTARKKERRAGGDDVGEDEVVVGSKRRGAARYPTAGEMIPPARKRTRRQILLLEDHDRDRDRDDDTTSSRASTSEDAPDMMDVDVESTESDAAPHEAVTPEPLPPPPPQQQQHEKDNNNNNIADHSSKRRPAASVDDALLLLALHDARS